MVFYSTLLPPRVTKLAHCFILHFVQLCKSRAGLMMPVAEDGGESNPNPLAMSGESFASSLARWGFPVFLPGCRV